MKRLVTPFSLGLSLSLFVIAASVVVSVFYVHRAWALSNVGPDATDFAVGGTNGAYYTLSDTTDVKNTRSMGLNLYHPGAKPTSAVTVTVGYQGGAQTCLNQNAQGYAKVQFTAYVATTGTHGTATLSIPTSAWVSNGVGYSVDLTANIVDGTNSCNGGSDGDHVNFRLTAPSSYIIGPDASKNFAVAQGSYCVSGGQSCNSYDEYDVPFAPACTVNTAVNPVAVKIFDMDNDGTHPVIQPETATVKIVDTTTGATVNNNSYTGSESNGYTATFNFNYTPHHAYMLKIIHINLNNVIQMQIPFDSVNAQINCAPSGGITSSASAACTSLQGWMYDVDNSATQLQYYVYINPASTPPATYTSFPGGSNFIGPFTANLANPSGTASGTPANHGFKINIPADVTGHGYQGPWGEDNYYVYAKDASASNLKQVDSLDVPAGTCASVSCGTTDFAVDTVGTPDTFRVNMKLNGASTEPPGNPTFTITVTGSGVGTNNQTFSNVGSGGVTSGSVYSNPVTFKPTGAGSYSVTWSYYGTTGCNDSSNASYTPYFGVLGGDVAAGAGFGNGSCNGATADIETWNTNTDATPNYFGGGSTLGALATGDITSFVSGMGLSDYTSGTQTLLGHGLSFANTNNGKGNTPKNYGGGFGSNRIPCVADYYGTIASASPTGVSSPVLGAPSGNAKDNYSFTGDLTIGDAVLHGAITIPAGRTITLYVKGNVSIESNIMYAGYGLTNVPRFNLYVQGNIFIDPKVTELHGVYIAQKSTTSATLKGDINTCAETITTTIEPYNTCTSKLLVVGAMAAEGQLQLMRTHGNLVGVPAAGVAAEPAETFQYSPELWLNAPPLTQLNPKAYTSLPPVL